VSPHQHGSGTGTPIGGGGTIIGIPGAAGCTAISLVRYAQRIGYRECAFFGVNHPDNIQYACSAIWTKAQRDMIAWALAEAQGEIEQEIGYLLAPCWIAGERVKWRSRVFTRWGHVIEPGIMSDTMLAAGLAVNHATDPATIVVALGTCDESNVHIFFPGTDVEIVPSATSKVGGILTLSVPWCRLVAPAYQDNPDTGLDYNDHATWITATVDARCIANDASTQATLIWRYGESGCSPTCEDEQKTACIYVRDPQLGIVDVSRATYANGVWSAACLCACQPDWALLNYRAGVQVLTNQMEDMIIRLAHAKMAEEPCGCAITQRLWRRDRNVPQVLTRERINCPFGESDGAWWAYRQAQTLRIVRGSIL
jgi:hypothetical protein